MFGFVLFGIALTINYVIADFVGGLGKYKKIGYSTSFWVSFLLSPLIGLLSVIASVPLSERELEELNKPVIKKVKKITPEQEKKNKKIEKITTIFLYSVLVGLPTLYLIIILIF